MAGSLWGGAAAVCQATGLPTVTVNDLAGGVINFSNLQSSPLQTTILKYGVTSESNSGFLVTVSSANGGKLRREGGTHDLPGNTLTYTVTTEADTTISGSAWVEPTQLSNISLTTDRVLQFSTSTQLIPTGFLYKLKANFPVNKQLFRGTFSDTISISISDL